MTERYKFIRVVLPLTVALLFVVMLLITGQHTLVRASPSVLYVAPGGNCGGTSPCYASIQDAVDAAVQNDEIRIAAGTYYGVNDYAGLSQVVFVDKNLTIKGGYTPSNWDNANPDANPVEINALAQGRAMVISGTVNVTVNGLILSYGNAAGLGGHGDIFGDDDAGGGLYVAGADVTLDQIEVLTSTVSDGNGGGLYQTGGSLDIQNSTLQGNYASEGGGAYFHEADVYFANNVVQKNTAGGIIATGAGIHLEGGEVTITRSIIRDNLGAGGISNAGFNNVNLTLTDNLIANNDGRGLWLGYTAVSRVTGNRIERNKGGVSIVYADVTLLANRILSNTLKIAEGAGLQIDGDAKVLYNLIQGNRNDGSRGAGVSIYNCGSDTVFAYNTIRKNISDSFGTLIGGKGGGIALNACNEMPLVGNTIVNNTAVSGGSSAPSQGGGLYLYRSDVIMTNNFIVDNVSGSNGSGIHVEGSSPSLYHTTIANNTGGDGAGIFAMYNDSFNDPGVVTLYNTIIVSQTVGVKVSDDSPQNVATLDSVLWWNNGSNVTGAHFAFNEVSGDPLFADVPNRDYHIQAGSAAIDAANATYTVAQDIDNEPRWGSPDLGADEYWAPGALKRIYLPLVIR